MRIALCFSGHLRSFLRTKNSILNNLIYPLKEKNNVDIFIHTWDSWDTIIGPKGIENNIDITLVKREVFLSDFVELNPSKICISNYEELKYYFDKSIILPNHKTFYGTNEKYTIIDNKLVPYIQLYGIFSANQLKKTIEDIREEKYDLVFRLRFDFAINDNILKYIEKKEETIFLPNLWRYKNGTIYALNDTFAFGDSKSMDIYSNTILNYRRSTANCSFDYEENQSNCLQLGVEQTLYREIKHLNIIEIGNICRKI